MAECGAEQWGADAYLGIGVFQIADAAEYAGAIEVGYLHFGFWIVGTTPQPRRLRLRVDAGRHGRDRAARHRESLFFDHRDPKMVKFLSEAKRNT
jgi:hypothetical protein